MGAVRCGRPCSFCSVSPPSLPALNTVPSVCGGCLLRVQGCGWTRAGWRRWAAWPSCGRSTWRRRACRRERTCSVRCWAWWWARVRTRGALRSPSLRLPHRREESGTRASRMRVSHCVSLTGSLSHRLSHCVSHGVAERGGGRACGRGVRPSVQANSRTHVPQKRTGFISIDTSPVSIISVLPVQTVAVVWGSEQHGGCAAAGPAARGGLGHGGGSGGGGVGALPPRRHRLRCTHGTRRSLAG
jgi:hypothetical protein